MQLFKGLRSHIQYQIILPFLLLTLMVAMAGSAVSILFITGNAQERLNNQLAQSGRSASDTIVEMEQSNLQFLREVAFAGANPAVGAPSVADALANHNTTGLQKALDPYFIISAQRQGIRVDRMIAFDTTRHSVLDWEYASGEQSQKRVVHASRDISALWFVPAILGKQSDALGDKYSGLLDLGSPQERYLFTVAPVMRGNTVVGGLIVASRLESTLQTLLQRSSSAIVSVYRAEDGSAFASTQVPAAGLQSLSIQPQLVPSIRDMTFAQKQAIFDTVNVNKRTYQFAYVPLRIRSSVIGLLSVALSSDYVIGPWANAGTPLMATTVVLMLAIIGLGVYVARQITHPLEELVATAQEVTGGNLERRSLIDSSDEVGILSRSFNDMTEHLVDLYDAVRGESSQRAAIVESITDGVVVCDPQGRVLVINRTMRDLLDLQNQDMPSGFNDIPLLPLDEPMQAFGGAHVGELFTINNRIVRVASAAVATDEHTQLGTVYVFQDLTNEVAIDRAKTNFIATISHELRTPLTVLGGSADLLLRGFVGELSQEQRQLIEAMNKHSQSMTRLLNNVITIANLESGTLEFELEPVALRAIVDELEWSYRTSIRAKNLRLEITVPDELPDVIADSHQLRHVLSQLLDNAHRYTQSGMISITAVMEQSHVRVDIRDTGPGIDSEVSANLFNRFVRGVEGINSAERGIGLGLAIAKILIERQGGTIWLAETSHQGSTFSFTLPCIHADSQTNNSSFAHAA